MVTVMTVMAHPDDAELWAGGALAAHAAAGGRAVVAVPRHSPIRDREAAAGADAIGAQLHRLDDAGAETVAALLRQVRPDVVITHPPHDIHPNHRAVAEAVNVALPEVVKDSHCCCSSAHTTRKVDLSASLIEEEVMRSSTRSNAASAGTSTFASSDTACNSRSRRPMSTNDALRELSSSSQKVTGCPSTVIGASTTAGLVHGTANSWSSRATSSSRCAVFSHAPPAPPLRPASALWRALRCGSNRRTCCQGQLVVPPDGPIQGHAPLKTGRWSPCPLIHQPSRSSDSRTPARIARLQLCPASGNVLSGGRNGGRGDVRGMPRLITLITDTTGVPIWANETLKPLLRTNVRICVHRNSRRGRFSPEVGWRSTR